MKRIKMTVQSEKNFEEGFEEYVLDMKARNLREGTIRHYQQAIKQIYKRIPEDTLISEMSENTMPEFIVALRDDPKINEVSMGTYARDFRLACCLELLKPFHHLP